MAIKVKDTATIAKKWATRAGAAGQDYTSGVQNPSTDWATATTAAANTYASGVQQAVSDGRFAKGVSKAGTSKWQTNAVNKGSSRYTQGVTASTSNYQTAMDPYMQTLAGLTLPARMPKGDPSNINRVTAVDTALRNKKING
jgi:hypothetical protein